MTTEPAAPAVEFAAVDYAYPDGTPALSGVTFALRAGERLALLGPNGAGKSTLLLHVNGVLRPAAGTVRVGGVELGEATVRDVRTRVGLVFQDPDDQLFMTTLYEDVAFGPMNMGFSRAVVDERVHRALHAVGLAAHASKPGQHLSYGQRKRAALATVLSMSPTVLVLDEPTSDLDPRSRRQMIELLASLDVTMLLATHDLDLAWSLCQRAIVMDGGTVVADGPRQTLLTDAALLEAHGLELPWAVRAAR